MATEKVTIGFFTHLDELGPGWVPLGKFNRDKESKGSRSIEYREIERAIHTEPPLVSARKRVTGLWSKDGSTKKGRIWVKESEALAYLEKMRQSAIASAAPSRPAVVKAEAQRDLFECRADGAALSDAIETLTREVRAMRAEVAKLSDNLGPTFETFDAVRDGWVGKDGAP
jgi:hypothetical protein